MISSLGRPSGRSGSFRLLVILVAATAILAGAPSAVGQPPRVPTGSGTAGIVSSNSGSNQFTGFSINDRVGAGAFYAAGFTGTRAIAANIEGGHIWNGHETLGHVTTFIDGPGSQSRNQGAGAAMDRHATFAAHALGGRATANPPIPGGEFQKGLAHGATLWSGSLAAIWIGPPHTLTFDFASYSSYLTPYHTAMVAGVGGQTADVVNSSWGNGPVDSPGRDEFTMGMDAMVRASNKVVTFCAGNSGAGPDSVWGMATAYNVISVGALASDTSNPTYNTPAGFSSQGPNDGFRPNAAVGFGTSNGTLFQNVRVRVDIAAPGQDLTLAFYGGTTGGNTGGTGAGSPTAYEPNVAGTSFAAPIVAGGAALLVDVGRALGLANAADGRVVKAVLLNSADKTQGWNNGQTADGGVVQTTQALDVAVGAGRLNLARAFPYYADSASTRDVAGTNPGPQGPVAATGWDFGVVNREGQNDYTVNGLHLAGSAASVTLTWFIDREINLSTLDPATLSDNALANLDLEVWRVSGGVFTTRVAQSFSSFNNTEHLFFTLPEDGEYGIRVAYTGDVWNFVFTSSETYAVAWDFVPVPEPAGALIISGLLTGSVAILSTRRMRSELTRARTKQDARV